MHKLALSTLGTHTPSLFFFHYRASFEENEDVVWEDARPCLIVPKSQGFYLSFKQIQQFAVFHKSMCSS